MATRGSPYLTIDKFPHAVVNKKFPLLSVVWYLFNVLSGNGHQTRGSNGNALIITTTGNVFVTTFGNQTIFGLCHASLNLLNSMKAIYRKL